MNERKRAHHHPHTTVTDLRLPSVATDGGQQANDVPAIRSGVGAPPSLNQVDPPPAGLVDGETVSPQIPPHSPAWELFVAAVGLAVSLIMLGGVLWLEAPLAEGPLLVGLTVAVVVVNVADVGDGLMRWRSVRRCPGCAADSRRARAAEGRLRACRHWHRLAELTGVAPAHPGLDVAGLAREEAIDRGAWALAAQVNDGEPDDGAYDLAAVVVDALATTGERGGEPR